jgi:hypothetical protein
VPYSKAFLISFISIAFPNLIFLPDSMLNEIQGIEGFIFEPASTTKKGMPDN